MSEALDIERLIPHRGPMRLVDRLLADDGSCAVVEATVRPDAALVEDGQLPGVAGLEVMAQAVAAVVGARHHPRQAAPRPGLLLGTRLYECAVDGFPVGTTLTVEVREELRSPQGLGVFSCRLLAGGALVASASLNLFQPDDEAAFMRAARGD